MTPFSRLPVGISVYVATICPLNTANANCCLLMGKITEQLRKEFAAALRRKIVPRTALQRGEQKAAEIETVADLIAGGRHPFHAVYSNVANLLNLFVEELVDLPFLNRAHAFLLKAQDLYSPGYPPMSPITVSYYVHWTLFDVPFGADRETLGDCFLGVSDLLGLDPVQVEAGEKLCHSRLGLYRIVSATDGTFRLREMITDREFDTIIPTGFNTEAGRLALIRVLPPLHGMPSPHIAVTTPYVVVGTPEADWLEYFVRQQVLAGSPGAEDRLHRHMKHSQDDWYWTEFFFYGYVNHRSDAIFVAGVPDRPETQPHHPKFNESTWKERPNRC